VKNNNRHKEGKRLFDLLGSVKASLFNKRHSILLKYFLVFLAIAITFIGLITPIYLTATDIIRKNIKSDFENNCNIGIKRLERAFESITHMDYNLTNADYLTVKLLDDEKFSSSNVMKLISAQRHISSYSGSLDLISDVYVIFRNNSKVITKNTIYMDSMEFFSKYMVYGGYSAEKVSKMIDKSGGNRMFIPSVKIDNSYLNGYEATECLTFIVKNKSSSVAICAVYKMDDIKALFPEYSSFWLASADGMLLSGEQITDYENYTIINYDMTSFGVRVGIGLPNVYLTEQIEPLQNLISLYYYVLLISGLILTFLPAIYMYLPLYNLVKDSVGEYALKRNRMNEFELLRMVWSQSNNKVENLNETLISTKSKLTDSIIINTLLNGSFSDDEYIKSEELEKFDLPCRIVLINIDCKLDCSEIKSIRSLVSIKFSENGLSTVRITPNQLVILLVDSERSEFEDIVQRLFLDKQQGYIQHVAIVVAALAKLIISSILESESGKS
jgi:hypothetical protein